MAPSRSASHFSGFDYTALGHLHAAQSRGAENIRYSGSILKYSFSEEHHLKSVTLVDMDAGGECSVAHRSLKPLHELRTLEGMLEDLLETGRADSAAEDYLQVRLEDRHAILDVMGKLREVYPNVLHLERPGLQAADSGQQARRARLKQGELSMFEDFYRQVRDEEMDIEQRALISQTIDRIHRDEA